MGRPKNWKSKRDVNEKEIIRALEAIGCTVVDIGTPVDLLVGYRSRNFLLEVKNPNSRYGRENRSTPAQREFLAGWKGQVRVVYSPEEAIQLVTEAYSGRERKAS